MTVYGEIAAVQEDINGYINYVIEIYTDIEQQLLGYKHVACTRYPNWECKELHVGDKGFFTFEIRRAGIDKWFDGTNLIPYNYDSIQFINYIPRGETKSSKCIM